MLLPDGAHKHGLVEDIVVGDDGLLHAPERPGLGHDVDMDLVRRTAIATLGG